jgi:hypothetical protein
MRFDVFLRRFANSYNKDKKLRSSGHVEIDSTCPDNCQLLIGSPARLGIDNKMVSIGEGDY